MLLQQLVNGLTLGATYALVGAAFSLTIGVLNVLNLALSEIFMVGAFLTFAAVSAGIAFPVAVLLGVVGGGAVNLVVERVAYRPLRRDPLLPLVGTIACSIILQNVATNIWGSDQQTFPAWFAEASFPIGPVLVSSTHLSIVGTAVILLLALDLLLQRTKWGRDIRAVAESPDVAEMLGVNTVVVLRLVFALSGALAAVAGILVGLAFGQITPFMGVDIGLKGIAAMVVGGLGNVRATIVGGIVLGLTEVLSVAYVSSSYRDVVVYGALIVMLLVRPQGLLGHSTQLERV